MKQVTYQNKDVTSKFLAEHFKGKSFRVYGLDLPDIQEVLPTNIPIVQARELRIDNLFLLADGSAAIIDYESVYKESDKVKYLHYLMGIVDRYLAAHLPCPVLQMIVIYTGNIQRSTVSTSYHIGAIRLELEVAFLSELDSKEIFTRLQKKVLQGEALNDEELMEFIILPLSYRGKQKKQQKIQETVKLAAQIQNKSQQLFTLAGLLVFTDKLIDQNTADQIRRMIEMTQVARIFEEEKQLAIKQIRNQERQQTVLKMIERGYPSEEIALLVPGYSREAIEELRKGH